MAYVIIENEIVVFKSNKKYPNSISVDDSVRTGMIRDKDGSFKNPPIPQEILMRELRMQRHSLLQESDWTQNRDIKLPNDKEWEVYRQELRDLPANVSKPIEPNLSNVEFPSKPIIKNDEPLVEEPKEVPSE
jgi:hypothetical protein